MSRYTPWRSHAVDNDIIHCLVPIHYLVLHTNFHLKYTKLNELFSVSNPPHYYTHIRKSLNLSNLFDRIQTTNLSFFFFFQTFI